MYEEHPVFNPPSADAVLWRYMDFTKFVSILEKESLFFVRADKLGDPFEGSCSYANKELRPIVYKEWFKDKTSKEALQTLVQFRKEKPRFTLINCWHENPHESEAMWKMYSRENDGIAIKTIFDLFKKSFTCNESIYIGSINYVDYDNYFIPEANSLIPFLHKRKSFEHEREVRAIVSAVPVVDGKSDMSRDICDIGKYYRVDLSVLIQEVVVAPFAPDWFLKLVKSVTARYNFNFPVVKSSQADDPMWE